MLFKVKVKKIEVVEAEIAVEASSLKEALDYMYSTQEYMEDAAFDNTSYDTSVSVTGINEINSIDEVQTYESDSLPWGFH
jgi:hypothetical protein